MTSSLSTASEGFKSEDTEDGVVANETLVISPVPSRQGGAVQEKEGVVVVVGKEPAGPPDGGYGWIVVMYLSLERVGVDV
jgi:hypothetical protein